MAKAQIELNLTTVAKDKKCFYKCINHKKSAKETLHPLVDVGGNIVNKGEEKAEVLHAFVASVFNTYCLFQGTHPPVLEAT